MPRIEARSWARLCREIALGDVGAWPMHLDRASSPFASPTMNLSRDRFSTAFLFVASALAAGCSSASSVQGSGPTDLDAGTHADVGTQEIEASLPPPDDAGLHGRSVIGWAVDYPADVLQVISQHESSFTHVAVLIYDITTYSSGVAPFWNTPGGADVFEDGLTSATMASKVHGMGLGMLAAMFGGQEFGSNQGLVNLLDDSPAGTQAGFISAMATEAKTKGYDGYVLDLALGGAPTNLQIGYANDGVKMQGFLGAFRAALHAQQMLLAVAIVPNDVKQSCTSYGNGVFDLQQLGKYVDLVMLEDYGSSFGTASPSCPTSYTDPTSCFLDAGSVFGPFANGVDLLCADTTQNNQMTVMMNASPGMTNPFAGQAISLVESYGIPSISVFPEINKEAADGGYVIYDPTGLQPSGSDWFTLTAAFLAAKE
jgi:hypothetical protein